MSGLPQGWSEASLGDLAAINPGRIIGVSADTSVSFVPMPAVSDVDGEIVSPTVRQFAEVSKGYTQFKEGDVIFAKITPCMENGKIAVARSLENGTACGSTEFHVVRPLGGNSPDYIWQFLRQKSFREDAEGSMTGAVGQRRVPASYLKESRLPLPPLPEQRRIVAKIDSLTGKSKSARDHLDHIPRLVEKYKQAVLAAAFRGDLTRELGSSSAPGWRDVALKDVAEIQSGIALGKKRTRTTNLVRRPYLRVANVQRGWLSLTEVKEIEVTEQEAARLYLRAGDILMNEGGDRDKLGRGWIWEGQIKNCIHQNHVFRVRLFDREFPPKLISLYANEFGQSHFFDEGTQTTNLASISKTRLSSLPLRLPPVSEAVEIVRRVEIAFSWINQLASNATSARKLIDRLDQAVLTKAFRGELVPQDPTDEPASVLLERIKTARADATPGKRRRASAR
jgi:type I restriction enzyme S subunit